MTRHGLASLFSVILAFAAGCGGASSGAPPSAPAAEVPPEPSPVRPLASLLPPTPWMIFHVDYAALRGTPVAAVFEQDDPMQEAFDEIYAYVGVEMQKLLVARGRFEEAAALEWMEIKAPIERDSRGPHRLYRGSDGMVLALVDD